MTENEHRPPEGWYPDTQILTDRLDGWYPDPGPLPEAAEPEPEASDAGRSISRNRRAVRIGALALCVILVLAAIAWALQPALAPKLVPAVREAAAGTPKPEEHADNYREYFADYFTSSGDVDIPQTRAAQGMELEIHSQAGREPMTLQEIYALVNPAVVGVTGYSGGTELSWGTGVLFTADGYLITNTHMIQGTDSAVVTLSTGREYRAMLIGEDEESDIAVLKIDGSNLPYAEFGISDELSVGDGVAAIGNPLGENYAGTMTDGIISSINRSVTQKGHKQTLLQTNAALNEGNSGGPMVNMYGQVIGITNMKIMSVFYTTVEGIGFAIPSAVVKEVADQLLSDGSVAGKPAIGIVAGAVSDEARELYGIPAGVYVSQVNDGSDAKAQGLLVGDIITRVNGIAVASVDEVNEIKGDYAVGDVLTLTVYRDGDVFEMKITLVDKTDVRK